MLIEKTNIFFSQHGIEKDVWSQMFYTTSRRIKSSNGHMIGKNEKIAPNINLFSKALKGKYKITWKISDKDFADTLVTTIFKSLKEEFYDFCKENLPNISVSDTNSIDEEMIYNMIRSLATKIKAESFNILKYKNENSDCIESDIASDLSANIKLLTNIKPCRSVFKGRDGLILQMYDHLQMKNHFLFLQGIGGIGKSECAKQFAEKYKNQYDVIVFSECPDSLVSSVNDNNIFTLTEPFYPKQSIESDRQFYERKLNQLKMLKEKILIILDNVDYFSEEIDDFLTLPFDIIITTRYDYFSEYPGQTIHINEIENMMILKDIFSEYYGKNVSNDPFTEKIINMFERHTMAIELIAKQAKASNLTPQEIFDIMNKNDGYEFQETFRVMNYDRKQLNIFSYMQKLFNIASLTEQEQYIMMCLSLLPLTGMEKRKFKNCCGLKDYSVINKLIELSWIRDIDGKLSIHTLIKETIKIFCKPDLVKCHDFINGLITEFPPIQCWHSKIYQKNEIKTIVENIYNMFPIEYVTSKLYDFYEWIELMFTHFNNSSLSLKISYKLLKIYRENFGENHFRTAKRLTRIACAEKDLDNIDKAEKLFVKSRKIISELKNRSEYETLYLSDIDLVLSSMILESKDLSNNKDLLNEVKKLSEESIDIRKQFPFYKEIDPLSLNCASLYRNLAWIEIYNNNYEKVHFYFNKIVEECERLSCKHDYFLKEHLETILFYKNDDLYNAVNHMKNVINEVTEYSGKQNIRTIYMNIELGDIYLKLGDVVSAYTQYETALKHLEKMPCQNTKIHTYLTEKIDTIKNK